jgi:hypothetical protein
VREGRGQAWGQAKMGVGCLTFGFGTWTLGSTGPNSLAAGTAEDEDEVEARSELRCRGRSRCR